ncbi:MAG: hypothetical protein WC730_02910 [Patescibacteria group bacterium]|jgi:hypothetical protein
MNKFLFWAPRILIILFALFLGLFSLDIFDIASTPSEIAVGLFMHNLPSLVLLIILAISWKHDLVGAIIFLLFGLACIIGILVALLSSGGVMNPIFIIGGVTFFVIAAFFLVGWKKQTRMIA